MSDRRRGKNTQHQLIGLLRQSVFGRFAGYEDVNDAERLARDPAMRAIVGCEMIDRAAASNSEMGRFETEWLATARSWSRSAPGSCVMGATPSSSWPRWQCPAPCSPRSCAGSIGSG
jgi:hypothetical protein